MTQETEPRPSDPNDPKNAGRGPVAPADEPYRLVSAHSDVKAELVAQNGESEPAHPGVTHPHQPSFPRPVGLPKEGVAKLIEQGVVHTYQGLAREVRDVLGREPVEVVEDDTQTPDQGEQTAGVAGATATPEHGQS